MEEQHTKVHKAKKLEDANVISYLYWKVGFRQNIGARKEQQDDCGVVLGDFHGKPALLAVLADGMGGMNNGAAYSRLTVDFHRNNFQRVLDHAGDAKNVLLPLALGANKEAFKIYDEERPGGTTLISVLCVGDSFYTLSVGDSRIYLFRKNVILNKYVPLQLNREHVMGAVLDERAWDGQISFEDARENTLRDSLISAIGEKKIRRVDQSEGPTRFIGGDKLALMSDGVYRALTDLEIAAEMDAPPAEASDAIVEHILAKQLPYQDNMSIIVLERI